MTTEREYQEGQRRMRKYKSQPQKKGSPFIWILMGMMVFVGLMVSQVYQDRSPKITPTNQEAITS